MGVHGLEAGYAIRTVQELLGHKDASTIMIDTHVFQRSGRESGGPAGDGALQGACRAWTVSRMMSPGLRLGYASGVECFARLCIRRKTSQLL
jgi:hypothetical protein